MLERNLAGSSCFFMALIIFNRLCCCWHRWAASQPAEMDYANYMSNYMGPISIRQIAVLFFLCNAILFTMPKCCGLHSSISNWDWCMCMLYGFSSLFIPYHHHDSWVIWQIGYLQKATVPKSKKKYMREKKEQKQNQMKANRVKENGIYAE